MGPRRGSFWGRVFGAIGFAIKFVFYSFLSAVAILLLIWLFFWFVT